MAHTRTVQPVNAVDRYAVIGNPIAQSQSPGIHLAFAAAMQQSLSYTRLLAPLDDFAGTVDAFRAQGGLGLNVTAPFKLQACAYATHTSASALWAGAANALKFEGPHIYAENFDGVGLVRDVTVNLQTPLKVRRVLLLGAGGAARGALHPLLMAQPRELVIANRTPSKVDDLLALAAQPGLLATQAAGDAQSLPAATAIRGTDFAGLQAERESFDVVFNATSSSLTGQDLDLPMHLFARHTLAYDLSYGKGLTPFLRRAQTAGARCVDGVGMLVEQAAEAFVWWRGVRPPTAAVIARLQVPLC